MKLDNLREAFDALSFPAATAASTPERNTICEARKLVASAVTDDEFLLDCISREIPRLRDSLVGGLAPFFTMPATGIRVAFGYWAPGDTAGPHEHTAWTITAVCRNELDVKTFDREASYRSEQFVPKHHFKASAGTTGFIFDPCIHEPLNTSDDWSLSLHITSPREGEDGRDRHALWKPSRVPQRADEPTLRLFAARYRHDYAHLLARILAGISCSGARAVLADCLAIASSSTRRRFAPPPRRAGQVDEREPWRLARVHPDLDLTDHCQDGMVSLAARTSRGLVDGLVVSDVARGAIHFAANAQAFDVQSLPGDLSESERMTLAEALEETGFFVRVQR